MGNGDIAGEFCDEIIETFEDKRISIEDIKEGAANVKEDAKSLLDRICEVRREIAREMRDVMISDNLDRKELVAEILSDLKEDRGSMSRALRDSLALESRKRKEEVSRFLEEETHKLRLQVKELREQIRDLLEDIRNEIKEIQSSRKELQEKIRQERNEVFVQPEPVPEYKVEEAGDATDEGEILEDIEDKSKEELKSSILDVVGEHPEGIKMVEIAVVLEIENWRSLIPIIRELVVDKKLRKEDSYYFL